MSRSYHRATSSSATWAFDFTTRARPQTRSAVMGLRLWGMAEEPFWPFANGSSASMTSDCCSRRTCMAMDSSVEAVTARAVMTWAWRSRAKTWVERGSGVRPSFSQTYCSTNGSMLEYVPTAPLIAPVAATLRASSRRVWARFRAQAQLPNFMPKVMGSAWMPWVRPTHKVSWNSKARRLQVSPNCLTSSRMMSTAWVIW